MKIVSDKFEYRCKLMISHVWLLMEDVFRLCNLLPREAVQSSDAFMNCLYQIATTEYEVKHEYKNDKSKDDMRLQASVLRSGAMFINHLARVHLKYVVEYVLEQYQKVNSIPFIGPELVPQPLK